MQVTKKSIATQMSQYPHSGVESSRGGGAFVVDADSAPFAIPRNKHSDRDSGERSHAARDSCVNRVAPSPL